MIKYRAFCSFDSIGAKIRKRWDTDQIFGGVFLKKQKAWISQPTHAFLFYALFLLTFSNNLSPPPQYTPHLHPSPKARLADKARD